MLDIIQHHIRNPDDIPDIAPAAAQYLAVRLNASYLIATGVVDELRKAGYSEGYIAGFLDGANAAVEITELMQESQLQREE
ncbi:hypothetical protein ALEA_31 [Pseudomonas phage ALEA]|uniref:Uncharacterized protein n=1 Tax=Pseudomonas phage AH05 TaxID=2869574 RepID=A0AAE8BR09_9CAUD|nr:hypothetical protein AH05_32 [Pseudomonas phage AH05]UAV89335.1 hypothetical protein ALEA_31 [Pseudomonas phage ALEA]UAV89434.1 hypothetical protein JOR_30 [Pseudomonas phage JOR]UAV89484.1 hypothetical protein M11_31 [Pseudomonas phage M1.1]UAV89533.1 hypothetical protein M12_30 [Pseudomonas phage M1.2]UAV89582.1 hypothetical protein M31_30 [Pseudomonas phage M3.1]UAV89805.1 hypothetical protein NOI_30 [Pseudomonas phage NOI]UAV90077.1 hypothetical protein SNK_31 [Pseudomonas phage SNK]